MTKQIATNAKFAKSVKFKFIIMEQMLVFNLKIMIKKQFLWFERMD